MAFPSHLNLPYFMPFLLLFLTPYTTREIWEAARHSTHHIKAHLMISNALQSFNSQDPTISQTTQGQQEPPRQHQTLTAALTAQREKLFPKLCLTASLLSISTDGKGWNRPNSSFGLSQVYQTSAGNTVVAAGPTALGDALADPLHAALFSLGTCQRAAGDKQSSPFGLYSQT